MKTKNRRAIEITDVTPYVFRRILGSLKRNPSPKEVRNGSGDNHGGWTLPLAVGNPRRQGEEGEGWLILLPTCIEYQKTRQTISRLLGLKLEDYDIIEIQRM